MVTLVIALLVAVCVGYGIVANTRSLRVRKPFRDEIRARPATFRAKVDLQTHNGWLWVCLSVHGDAFEVAEDIPVIGFIYARDYCYRAQDTTLAMVHGFRHDWIKIRGLPGTGAEPIAIGHRTVNHLLWDVLVGAGAHPIGPPPQSP